MINHLHWIGDGHGTSANAVFIEDVGCWSNHYLLHVKATMRLIFLCGRKSWKKKWLSENVEEWIHDISSGNGVS